MLKAYEVIIENGQIKWLTEQPDVKSACAILTFLEDVPNDEKIEADIDTDPNLEALGGSEPQSQYIPRRRYEM